MTTDEKWSKAYERAIQVVSKMTVAEKVNLTTGTGWNSDLCVGNTGAIPRFGIPSLCLQDGPLGVRFADLITAFPAAITAGTSFNKNLIAFRARAMAYEFKGKGAHVILGPAVGPLGRNALGGRTWEGFGSDPYLQGIASRITTREIQEAGLIATVKHYIGNEQEHYRQVGEYYGPNNRISKSLSSNIDDRTLHEVYLWPFADCVNEGIGSVMCSYNQINHTYACENSYLMNKVLKEELGFQGFIMSDWWAMKTGAESFQAGLDMAMPGDRLYFSSPDTMGGNKITQAVATGKFPDYRLNDIALRVVAAYYYVGLDKNEVGGPNFSSWTKHTDGFLHPIGEAGWTQVNKHIDVMNNELSRGAALQTATEGVVLLKNDFNILPLDKGTSTKPRRINIFGIGAAPDARGPNCRADMACSNGALGEGWGSGAVDFSSFVTPFESISEHARHLGINVDYDFTTFDFNGLNAKAPFGDVNIIFAVTNAGEGYAHFDGNYGDRKNASLWHNADEVIAKAAELNKNNIVVVSSVGPANLERWIDHPNIKAVLFASPGGQEAGNAIGNVLFGIANPSGKLPYTIARDDKDYIPVVSQKPEDGLPQAFFSEGIYVDYKYFDKNNIKPRYEFGYGLSYSNFSVSNLRVTQSKPPSEYLPAPPKLKPVYSLPCNKTNDVSEYLFPKDFKRVNRYIYPWVENANDLGTVVTTCESANDAIKELPLAAGGLGGNPALWETSFQLTATASNTGPYDGAYAFQLYIEFPNTTSFDVPVRQLRGFEKPFLKHGASTDINFKVNRRDISVWDTVSQSWVVPRGKYKFWIARSSRDLVLSTEIVI